jgi:hypothetical protein
VGFIPHERFRRWVNDRLSLIVFRIIVRSLSTVITIHNEEYKPKNCGFCVANHTSPIDVAVLSTDCTYSMVSNAQALPAIFLELAPWKVSIVSNFVTTHAYHQILFLGDLIIFKYFIESHKKLIFMLNLSVASCCILFIGLLANFLYSGCWRVPAWRRSKASHCANHSHTLLRISLKRNLIRRKLS